MYRLLIIFSLIITLCCAAALAAPIDREPTPPPSSAGPGENAAAQAESRWSLSEHLKQPEVEMARRALDAGKVEECIAHLHTAVEKQPSLPPDLLMLAYMYLADGNWNDGRVVLEKAAVVHAEHPEVYQAWGQLAAAQGRYTDAWVHFQQALRLSPPAAWSENQTRDFRLRCYLDLSNVCELREDWPGAAQAIELASELTSPDTALLGRWAKALLWAGNADASLEKFREAHRLDPSTHPPELSMAALLTERGEFDAARRWYETALKSYPQDGRVHFEFAGSLLLAGHGDEAAVQLTKATEVGTNLDELNESAIFLRGLIARSQGKNEEAEKYLKQLLRLSPGHSAALYHLPLVLVEQKVEAKHRQALQIAMLHAQKNPESLQAQAALGWVQFRLGQSQEAEASLRKAASGSVIDGETAYFLAQVLLANGKANEAQPVIAALRATVLSPQLFLLREEAREWLESVSFALE